MSGGTPVGPVTVTDESGMDGGHAGGLCHSTGPPTTGLGTVPVRNDTDDDTSVQERGMLGGLPGSGERSTPR